LAQGPVDSSRRIEGDGLRLDEQGLAEWGRWIGKNLRPPAIFGLVGSLGAGKSVLARAIGEGAGVGVTMPSPSFNLLFRYEADEGREVVHLDLYRIESPDDLWELGWSELGAENEIIIVEWPEQAHELMPPDHWLIHLTVVAENIALRDLRVQKVGSPKNDLSAFPISSSEC